VRNEELRQEARLDTAAVKAAYRRWAKVYDGTFGLVAARARGAAVALANRLPGRDVLEVGVGTGLSLTQYRPEKRVTGIDLSAEMLEVARRRVARSTLRNVVCLQEMDAERTTFESAAFDVVAAMFVASVVPRPERLMAEMKRIVRPGGSIIIVNHFAAEGGLRLWAERAVAPAARALGWHPDFRIESLMPPDDLRRCLRSPAPPIGLFTLVHLPA
jgi:phosphatidylethanolamine/phosphatidyl-N-methylethanolamine N-methyltransferase